MCITVTVLGVGLYLNSLGNDFTFDDPYAVKKNKEARWNAEWSTLITHDYWGTDVMAYDSQSGHRCTLTPNNMKRYMHRTAQHVSYRHDGCTPVRAARGAARR
jgi:hypothetical protein